MSIEPTFQVGERLRIISYSNGPNWESDGGYDLNGLKIGDIVTIKRYEKRTSMEAIQFPDGYIYFIEDHIYGYNSSCLERAQFCLCYPEYQWDDTMCFDCVESICP